MKRPLPPLDEGHLGAAGSRRKTAFFCLEARPLPAYSLAVAAGDT
jgi:hypothetical protein